MILVTGATGFVGSAVTRHLAAAHPGKVIAAVRRTPAQAFEGARPVTVGDLSRDTDWGAALKGVTHVVHAAARVHVMQDSAADPLLEYRRVNVEGTLRLAREAARAGVKRIVFLSSIKVNGESTEPGKPFTADQQPHPLDPYGVSKLEAENGLFEIGRQTGLEVVVIRPPLIYGPGVKANFRAMMRWLQKGVPLPLGAIDNRRSLVGLANLVDLIALCLEHPAAAGQRFLVSDGEDLSTTELLRRMAGAMGCKARLIPVSPGVLNLGAGLLGKAHIAQRLCGSLQVDIGKTRKLLGWQPPFSVDEGLISTAEEYVRETRI